MKNKEGIEYLNKKILKVGRGTDWTWWLLIVTVTGTMIVVLGKMLWAI